MKFQFFHKFFFSLQYKMQINSEISNNCLSSRKTANNMFIYCFELNDLGLRVNDINV